MEFDVERKIAAPADRIWRILTDAAGYADWDNGIVRIEGEIEEGATVRIWADDEATTIRIVDLARNERMTWQRRGRLGRTIGTRTFELQERPDGTTDVRIQDVATGKAARQRSEREADARATFVAFADALKRHAESTF
ncbi:MAG: SRPBCC family protein [Nitriliruptorales bacterium]|nr:SRPBCC family protein [Nitriliruptorales bacterium]